MIKNRKEIKFKCACKCGVQLMVNDFDDGQFEINVRPDGRHKWIGAVLEEEDVKKIIEYFNYKR